ncbi:Cloroperoxidase [Marasmius fiardii PR-910]|nr:Cloroperoxidase [Marasmius fiardii PR-910]
MKLLSSLVFIAVASTALADDEVDFSAHAWQAPGPNDSRSPCPGLNTLANHGFLPRNGKNISIPMIIQAGHDGYHFEADILTIAAKVGLLTSPDDQPTTLSLNDLKAHGVLEHDASLSRQDFALGDNVHFNETLFSTLTNSNPGYDVYNITSAGQVQRARLADSVQNNPNITNTDTTLFIRSAESAFYLSAMGDPIKGVAPKNFVQIFFREERMPIEEGWKRSSTPVTADTLVPLINQITAASQPWEPSGKNCPGILP